MNDYHYIDTYLCSYFQIPSPKEPPIITINHVRSYQATTKNDYTDIYLRKYCRQL